MNTMTRHRTRALWLVTLLGCASQRDQLVPVRATPRVDEGTDSADASRVSVEGVTLTAQVDAWPGEEDLESRVTPVYLSIENHSGAPLRLGYERLSFRADDGARFAALPPTDIRGSVTRPIQQHPTARLHPAWRRDGLDSYTPNDGTYNTGLPTADGVFFYDPLYYDQYYEARQTVALPTSTMVDRALPEGVIEDGERIEGFVYFERIGDKANSVRLQAELLHAQTGELRVLATIPFLVN
jgi:hypothetical protein